ncbi:pyrimidine reductase [Corynebacterium suranareeae]|uniref:Riboflavin biosynthesis protein RibD n=1 Tax=Corynebacterium suranareeae TaxID=2506452 RepID=A0A160PSL5_9CORY|nr:bifunctional diaminohydroxyphosphoribosylaminopyrimidine deaminase/5-amino-6-(5-phosphoribosylamino)uracil reductase RibD [Corynebacterium suranareeae]BAU95941.1 pyrimidine reductase [Corynebacterium suranareeae]
MDIAHALELAHRASEQVRGTTSPNPPVGAVILDSAGEVAGVGATAPPGGPHAEVVALQAAGERAKGGTAVVTLEPCNHYGRTGPCSKALVDAGIHHVFYANADPFPSAAGGADFLVEAGVETHFLNQPIRALQPWLEATVLGRPHVTLKFASTLDGFAGATDGTSQWITGATARAFVHEDRSKRDAIVVGTGTAISDNPSLTARTDDGLYPHQPRRVVIGSREISPDSNLAELGFGQYAGIPEALSALWDSGCRDVLIEGGPTLAAAALRLGVVDQIQAYVAPALLGAGKSVLNWPQATTMAEIMRFETTAVRQLGEDILIEMKRKDH